MAPGFRLKNFQAGTVSLWKVLVHEFGHVLGLAHSENSFALMFRSMGIIEKIGENTDEGHIRFWKKLYSQLFGSAKKDDNKGIIFLYGENDFPTIDDFSASPRALTPGENTSLVLKATDPEGDSLQYQWKKTGGKFLGCDNTSDTCTWTAPSRLKEYTLTAGVRDTEHNFFIYRQLLITVTDTPTLAVSNIEIKRIDDSGIELSGSMPTSARVDGTVLMDNPAFFNNLLVADNPYTASATDRPEYIEEVATCNLPGCSLVPGDPGVVYEFANCDGTWCSVDVDVLDGGLTRVGAHLRVGGGLSWNLKQGLEGSIDPRKPEM